MANRKNTFLLKRSNIAGKVPAAGSLLLGELGLNIADVILYASGTTANSILPIGWDRVARTGDTMTGGLFTPYLSATTISATTYLNLPSLSGDYLPLSGGTVYGPTIYTGGLTANTLNVTGLTQTSGVTSTGGIIFPHKTITSSYTATTADYFLNITGDTLDVFLMTAVDVEGKLLVVKNEGSGIVNVISQLGELIDDRNDVLLTKGNSVQLVSDGVNWAILGYNISSTQANTGVIEFSGLSKVTSSTFSVARVKGFIVDDVTNPTIPFLTYVEYTGGTHTALYVSSSTETYVYLTSGGTIGQTVTPLTEQQRRQNIFLGKLGHADKTSIINAFSQPDFVLTPLAQLRDMFQPIGFVNGGVVPYANAANLTFATTANYLYGLGINFSTDALNPNQLYVSGNTATTFQYRTQTGGTSSNVTNINPLNYDLNGVITPLTGTKATNQRIYLVQNGIFRIQYGQTSYANFAAAVAGISTETFNTFSNFRDNAILIGILTVLSTASDLTDTSKAQFFLASKFGETVGTAGGISTTNLQQAYNNSTSPEIVINATLDGLTIKNGTGNADDITRLLEGQTGTNGVTSFIRADGYISGTTFQSNGFIANSNGLTATTVSATTIKTASFTANNNGLTATTVSATTYYNLPTDIRVTGGTYSSGTTTFTNNTGGTFTVTGFSTSVSPISVVNTSSLFSTGLASTGLNASGVTHSIFFGRFAGREATSASNSVFLGNQAGYQATNAYYSNFFGNGAGIGSTNASYSNFFGNGAGDGVANANNSNFFGSNAGSAASDANNSNFFGSNAGYFATIATNSNFIGQDAGYGANAANNSNFIGQNTGYLADTADNSNFFGSSAGYGAGNAHHSNFMGYFAGYLSTGAFRSNFIGYEAGREATSAFISNFIGQNAGYQATGASYSNFMGLGAGQNATNAAYSNFIGQNAGWNATDAYNSNFIGDSAGKSAANAYYSNFIGTYAGSDAVGALASNFIGQSAGSGATAANRSNFIGQYAGLGATNANNSNFFGTGAGSGATASNRSNFIGQFAGQGATNASNSNLIGRYAGYQATGASNSNIFGHYAGYATSAANSIGSNNIIIGTNVTLSAGTTNAINIGGVLFGTGTYSDINTTPITSATTGGMIGIGVVNPLTTLHVSGDTLIEGGLTANTISATTYYNLPKDIFTTGGTYDTINGIATFTNNTGGTFNVNGFSTSGGSTFTGGTVSGATSFISGLTANTISATTIYGINLTVTGGTQSLFSGNSSSDLVRITQTGSGNAFVVEDSTNPDSTPFVINNSGNLGIGMSTPTYPLHISGASDQIKLSNGVSEWYIASKSNGDFAIASTGTRASLYLGSWTTTGSTRINPFGAINTNSTNDTTFSGGGNVIVYAGLLANTISAATTIYGANLTVTASTQSLFSGNSSVELVKITQNGSGDAFVVEDIANGDASHFVINSSGNTAIGLMQPLGSDKLTVSGNTSIYGGLTATTLSSTSGIFSGSGQSILTVIGSGNSSTSPIFSIQGSQGELFSVTDSLTGSLFSVNDISGLPILEVFSDNTTLMGSYQAPSLNTTTKVTLTAGTNAIYSIPTSAYTGAFFDYTVISSGSTGARAGNIMAIWSGTTTQYSETSTNDIGNTAGITFSVAVSGNNAVLSSSATTAGWTLKTIIRTI